MFLTRCRTANYSRTPVLRHNNPEALAFTAAAAAVGIAFIRREFGQVGDEAVDDRTLALLGEWGRLGAERVAELERELERVRRRSVDLLSQCELEPVVTDAGRRWTSEAERRRALEAALESTKRKGAENAQD